MRQKISCKFKGSFWYLCYLWPLSTILKLRTANQHFLAADHKLNNTNLIRLQTDLDSCFTWTRYFNISEKQFPGIGNKTDSIPELRVQSSNISASKHVENLGILISNELKLFKSISNRVGRCHFFLPYSSVKLLLQLSYVNDNYAPQIISTIDFVTWLSNFVSVPK